MDRRARRPPDQRHHRISKLVMRSDPLRSPHRSPPLWGASAGYTQGRVLSAHGHERTARSIAFRRLDRNSAGQSLGYKCIKRNMVLPMIACSRASQARVVSGRGTDCASLPSPSRPVPWASALSWPALPVPPLWGW
jgi:hypothetical protein